jgi:hypothetical protein
MVGYSTVLSGSRFVLKLINRLVLIGFLISLSSLLVLNMTVTDGCMTDSMTSLELLDGVAPVEYSFLTENPFWLGSIAFFAVSEEGFNLSTLHIPDDHSSVDCKGASGFCNYYYLVRTFFSNNSNFTDLGWNNQDGYLKIEHTPIFQIFVRGTGQTVSICC